MTDTPVLSVLARIEQLIGEHTPPEPSLHESWNRDKRFIQAVRVSLEQDEAQGARWCLEEMRNVSQGFGAYIHDVRKLDALLDALHSALQEVILRHRS